MFDAGPKSVLNATCGTDSATLAALLAMLATSCMSPISGLKRRRGLVGPDPASPRSSITVAHVSHAARGRNPMVNHGHGAPTRHGSVLAPSPASCNVMAIDGPCSTATAVDYTTTRAMGRCSRTVETRYSYHGCHGGSVGVSIMNHGPSSLSHHRPYSSGTGHVESRRGTALGCAAASRPLLMAARYVRPVPT